MGRKSSYTKDFKLQAIKLAEKNGSIPRTAKELGITDKTLYSWVRALENEGSDAFRGRGNLTEEAEKIRQLEAENKRLKETNEILKKATKFFASESN